MQYENLSTEFKMVLDIEMEIQKKANEMISLDTPGRKNKIKELINQLEQESEELKVARIALRKANELQKKSDLIEKAKKTRQIKNEIYNVPARKAAQKTLKKFGFQKETKGFRNASDYYQNGNKKFRISNHSVPYTDSRCDAELEGRFTWLRNENQIIINESTSVEDVEKMIIEILGEK